MLDLSKDINLFNGDCLEVMKGIPDGSVDCIITDPPYGTTQCNWDSIIDLELMWKELHRIVKDDGAICIFGAEPFSFVRCAVYLFDEDNDGTRTEFYFSEIEAVRFENNKYECEDIGGEVLNVTHYTPLPNEFDDGLGWLREAVSETTISKASKRDWFVNCKPDE